MRKHISRGLAALVFVTAGFTAAACHHHHSRHHTDGPATHAGQHIDHAADRAGDAIEGTGRAVNRALPGD